MKLLSRTEIMTVDDSEFREVEVPEWGGSLRLRSLSGSERDGWEEKNFGLTGKSRQDAELNIRASLICLMAVDEKGHQIFTPGDVAALGKKNAKALARVYRVASRLAGVTSSDFEEMVGNSVSGQSEDSGSDSAESSDSQTSEQPSS